MKNPTTPAEWQECVDLCTGLRMIADCTMYGLIEGGPKIDVRRCDDLLRRGKLRGYRPSRPAADLAIGITAAINQETENECAPKPFSK
jgi:hypothetical protein